MADLIKNIPEYIKALKHIVKFLEEFQEQLQSPPNKLPDVDYLTEFTEIKDLILSDMWPAALDPDLICADEDADQQIERATEIVNILDDITGKKVLDFGCGNGFVTYAISRLAKVAIGYDLKTDKWSRFSKQKNAVYSTDIQDLENNAPFDVILLYDVLDHITEENPIDTLKFLKSIKSPDGVIQIRCHPWTSRTATHVYKKANKAYLHLVLSSEELLKLGFKGTPTLELNNPTEAYKAWFREAGLEIIEENAIQYPIEMFFHTKTIVTKRIKDRFNGKFPKEQMETQFIDYKLK